MTLCACIPPKYVVGEIKSIELASSSGIEYAVVRSLSVVPSVYTLNWVARSLFAVPTVVVKLMMLPSFAKLSTPADFSHETTASADSLDGPNKELISSTSRYCPYSGLPGVETDASLDSSWSRFWYCLCQAVNIGPLIMDVHTYSATCRAIAELSDTVVEDSVQPNGNADRDSWTAPNAGRTSDSSAILETILNASIVDTAV